MARVLVTGGCGFIGSNFIHHLLKTYCDIRIVNLDKLTYAGNLENLADIAKDRRYHFILGDITDIEQVRLAMKNVEAVFNFAACSHVDRSIDDPTEFLRTNILGTQVLMDVAKNYKVAKYIQISTDEAFGNCDQGYFTEESPLQPTNPYAVSKASADLLAHSYVNTYNFPAIVTRCCNNYGPYQFPEKLIPLFICNLLRDDKCPVYGDGKQVRDWIHVLDHCAAIDFIWKNGKLGETYNIGARCERSNLHVAYALMDCIVPKDRNNAIEHIKDRPGHDRRYAVDPSKLEKLGWQPRVNFEDGLTDTVLWYIKNTKWIDNIRNGEYMSYYKKKYQEIL
jgi:dTDP-glucose 4,6-dehydratase